VLGAPRQTLKSIASFAQEACAIQWREHLVCFLHELYLKDNVTYDLIMGRGAYTCGDTITCTTSCLLGMKRLENPDQRITQDADLFTTQLADLIRKAVVVPGLIGYCTCTAVHVRLLIHLTLRGADAWYLWRMFGWVAPVSCFVYFIAGAAVNTYLIRRLVALVYLQEKYEGDFRHVHAWARVHIEQIALLRVCIRWVSQYISHPFYRANAVNESVLVKSSNESRKIVG
jgi:ABC-type uncharacterized transport system fused permease/ATPase subunit